MNVIFDNKLSDKTIKFKDSHTGDCFELNGELYFKGYFSTTGKPKAINIVTGEIIDLDNSVTIVPILAEFRYKR